MHPVPVSERISVLYLEKGILERERFGLVLTQGETVTAIPIGKTAVLMLGPGVTVTHAAIKICAEEHALILWAGERGVRLYAAANPRANSDAILKQATLRLDEATRLRVAREIFKLMFNENPPPRVGIEALRGIEGGKVKTWYAKMVAETGVAWEGKAGDLSNPINKALAGCNAALYGITEAIILAMGYSPSIGFVHTGDPRSFVFDIADTVKFHSVAPLAFDLATQFGDDLSESIVRKACRDLFSQKNLVDTLVSNLKALLDDANDCY